MPNYTPLPKVDAIIIHHSDSPRDKTTFEQIKSWHTSKGWIDIGYHFVVTGNGTMHLGRPEKYMGAQTLNHNYHTLGICMTGNFNNEKPAPKQIHTLVQILASLCRRYNLPASAIKGHRDYNATSCPGDNLYNQLPDIRKQVEKYL